METSNLLEATKKLYDKKPNSVSIKIISRHTGLTIGWLKDFARMKSPNPGVVWVEELYRYLSGKEVDLTQTNGKS
jgi:hypothetical protein